MSCIVCYVSTSNVCIHLTGTGYVGWGGCNVLTSRASRFIKASVWPGLGLGFFSFLFNVILFWLLFHTMFFSVFFLFFAFFFFQKCFFFIIILFCFYFTYTVQLQLIQNMYIIKTIDWSHFISSYVLSLLFEYQIS